MSNIISSSEHILTIYLSTIIIILPTYLSYRHQSDNINIRDDPSRCVYTYVYRLWHIAIQSARPLSLCPFETVHDQGLGNNYINMATSMMTTDRKKLARARPDMILGAAAAGRGRRRRRRTDTASLDAAHRGPHIGSSIAGLAASHA